MTLRGKVVDFVRSYLVDDSHKVGTVAEVAVVKEQLDAVHVRILVKMIYPARVERAGTPYDAVHLIAPGQQKFGKIAAVLSGDSGYKRLLHCRFPFSA